MTAPKWHHKARREYVDALLRVEAERVGYGAELEAELEAILQRLEAFPRSSVQLPVLPPGVEVRAFPLRRFKYTLMVAFEGDDPFVVAVAHQSREPSYWCGRIE